MDLGLRMRQWITLWFGFDLPVGRRTYFTHGVALFVVKYGVDVLLVWLVMRRFWTPLDYVNPSIALSAERMTSPATLAMFQLVWALPFLWIGVSMSMRRAIDAGRSAWLCLLFLCPFVNYLLMATLSLLPTASARPEPEERRAEGARGALRGALEGLAMSIAAGAVVVAVSLTVFGRYGSAVFVLAPFLMGALVGYRFNRPNEQGVLRTLGVTWLALAIGCGALILFAVEGGVCIAMALPIAGAIAMFGALFGRAIARRPRLLAADATLALLVLPLAPAIEPHGPSLTRVVTTTVVVAAPPEAIWRHVVEFSPLDEPPAWFFRLGIAYPKRATIAGAGVGAVRRCEFSTGAFIEPITAWEPPSRLAFDVASDPPPMTEWSPYAGLRPPHLATALHSRRGEFRLVPLPGGRTRLEGRTWYVLDIAPAPYWALWTDGIVHAIHARVLEHVKRLSESDAG